MAEEVEIKQGIKPISGAPSNFGQGTTIRKIDNEGRITDVKVSGAPLDTANVVSKQEYETPIRLGDYYYDRSGNLSVVPNSPTDIFQKWKYTEDTSLYAKPTRDSINTEGLASPLLSTLGGAVGAGIAGHAAGVGAALAGGAAALLPSLAISGVISAQQMGAQEKAYRDALEEWQKSQDRAVWKVAGNLATDEDGKIYFTPDASKAITMNAAFAGSELQKAFNKDTNVYFGDDGRLKVEVNPVYAATDEYKEIVDRVKQGYSGLTKDSDGADEAIEEIKQYISTANNQFKFREQSKYSYKSQIPGASDAVIDDAYMNEIGAYMSENDGKDYNVKVYRDGKIETKTAQEVLENVYEKDLGERSDYMLDLFSKMDDPTIPDDDKVYILSEIKMLYAADDNDTTYDNGQKDGNGAVLKTMNKYHGMLDQESIISALNNWQVVFGVSVSDVINALDAITPWNMHISKQEGLQEDPAAASAARLISTATSALTSYLAMQGIEHGVVRPLAGKIGGAISSGWGSFLERLAANGGRMSEIVGNVQMAAGALGNSFAQLTEGARVAAGPLIKALGFSMGELLYNATSDLLFDAGKQLVKALAGENPTGEEFLEDFGVDLAMDLVLQYGPAGLAQMQAELDNYRLDAAYAPYRAGVEGALRTMDAAELEYDAVKAEVADMRKGTKKYKEAEADLAEKEKAYNTAKENYDRLYQEAQTAVKEAMPSASEELGAKLAGKIADVEQNNVIMWLRKKLTDEKAGLSTIAEQAYARTGDVYLYQAAINKFQNIQAGIKEVTVKMLSDFYTKGTGKSYTDFANAYIAAAPKGKFSKTQVDYLVARAEYDSWSQVAKGDDELMAKVEEKYLPYLNKVQGVDRDQLDGVLETMRSWLRKVGESYVASGAATKKQIQDIESAALGPGYIPLWGKDVRTQKVGIFETPLTLRVGRTFDESQGLFDVEGVRNPVESALTYAHNVINNIARNEMAAMLKDIASIDGVGVELVGEGAPDAGKYQDIIEEAIAKVATSKEQMLKNEVSPEKYQSGLEKALSTSENEAAIKGIDELIPKQEELQKLVEKYNSKEEPISSGLTGVEKVGFIDDETIRIKNISNEDVDKATKIIDNAISRYDYNEPFRYFAEKTDPDFSKYDELGVYDIDNINKKIISDGLKNTDSDKIYFWDSYITREEANDIMREGRGEPSSSAKTIKKTDTFAPWKSEGLKSDWKGQVNTLRQYISQNSPINVDTDITEGSLAWWLHDAMFDETEFNRRWESIPQEVRERILNEGNFGKSVERSGLETAISRLGIDNVVDPDLIDLKYAEYLWKQSNDVTGEVGTGALNTGEAVEPVKKKTRKEWKENPTYDEDYNAGRADDAMEGRIPLEDYLEEQKERMWEALKKSNQGTETFYHRDENGQIDRRDTVSYNGTLYRDLYSEYGGKPTKAEFGEAFDDVIKNGENSKYYYGFKEFDISGDFDRGYNAGNEEIDSVLAIKSTVGPTSPKPSTIETLGDIKESIIKLETEIKNLKSQIRTDIDSRIRAAGEYFNKTYKPYGISVDIENTLTSSKYINMIDSKLNSLSTENLIRLKDDVARTIGQIAPYLPANKIDQKVLNKQVAGVKAHALNRIKKEQPELSAKEQNRIANQVVDNFKAQATGDYSLYNTMDDKADIAGAYKIDYTIDGKDASFYIKGKMAREVAAEMTTKNVNDRRAISEFFREAANIKRLLTTGIDPTRVIPNLLRDTIRNGIMSGGIDYWFFDNSPFGFQSMFTKLATAAGDTEEQITNALKILQASQEVASGATYNEAVNGRRTTSVKRLAESSTQVGDSRGVKFVWELAYDKKALLEAPMNWAEGLTRNRAAASAFTRAYMRGGGTLDYETRLSNAYEAGVNAARENTVNFMRRGTFIKEISAYVPYLSQKFSNIESTKIALLKDPIGVSSRIMMFGAAYMVELSRVLADEKSRRNYYNLSEYDRENNIILSMGGDGSLVTIPLDESISALIYPWRRGLESMHNVDPEDFYKIMVNGFLELSPFDLSGFTEGDSFNFGRGLEKLGAQMLPTILQAAYSGVSGRNMYYGSNIQVTKDDLAQYGNYNPTAGDYTTIGKNSALLRTISDAFGIEQWRLQQLVADLGGNVGQYVVNWLDKIGGAPEDAQGGKEFVDATFKSFTGMDSEQVKYAFNDGLSELKQEKEKVMGRLKNVNSQISLASGERLSELQEEYKKIKQEFAMKVGNFVDKYINAYEIAGGLERSQANQLWYLFNFSDDDSLSMAGSVESYYRDLAKKQANNEATKYSASVLDKYYDQTKNVYKDSSGDWHYYSPYGEQAFFNTIQGRGMEYQVGLRNLVEGKLSDLSSDRSTAYDLRDAAANAKDWDEYDRIGLAFDDKVLSTIKPYIERYGAENVLTNSSVLDYLEEWFFVPSSYMKSKYGKNISLAHNASKQRAFVRPYIKELFGLSTKYTDSNYLSRPKNLVRGEE